MLILFGIEAATDLAGLLLVAMVTNNTKLMANPLKKATAWTAWKWFKKSHRPIQAH